MRRLRQSKREGVGIRRVDAKLELELGRGAGRLAQRRRCPGRRGQPKQTPAGHFHYFCLPGALVRPAAVSVEPALSARRADTAWHADETILGNPRNRLETNGG